MTTGQQGFDKGFQWRMYTAEESSVVLARLQYLLSKESEGNINSRKSPKLKKGSMATGMIGAAGSILDLLPKPKEKSDYHFELRVNNDSDNLFVPLELTNISSGFRIHENYSICPPGEDTTLKMTFNNFNLHFRWGFNTNFLLSDENGETIEFKIDFNHDTDSRWVMHTMKFSQIDGVTESTIKEIYNPYSTGEELRLFRLMSTKSEFSCAMAFFSTGDNSKDSKVTLFLMPWLADADDIL
ncbi:TPA: hypothetical protein I8W54_002876 [Morganella morganii]|uniref:hypothetical protein n=1 Tax=Morganella morganii TaxID=582 RepID=UPI001A2D2431|nr:hypothetical protein [Morganella morganii]MCU6211027.1 hypothetical protein [Morganella morganii]HAT1514518.1 hypothetical protein [Morganella morganii]